MKIIFVQKCCASNYSLTFLKLFLFIVFKIFETLCKCSRYGVDTFSTPEILKSNIFFYFYHVKSGFFDEKYAT